MALNDTTGTSDGESLSENQSDIQKCISAERLNKRMGTYREHNNFCANHFNNSINTIMEEQQKQTSQLQQKSAETKNKKSNKKSEKRDNSLSLAGHSKNTRPLENESEMESAGKKQKLNDGSAVKSSVSVDMPEYSMMQQIPQIKSSNSPPVQSPLPNSSSANLHPKLESDLSEISLAPDLSCIKTEDGDFSNLSLTDLPFSTGELFSNADWQSTITQYLSIVSESVNNDNSESSKENMFNDILDNKLNFTNQTATNSGVSTSVQACITNTTNYITDVSTNSVQNNFTMHPEYKKLRMPGQNENIPASQTLKQMAEIHQTKDSPSNCARSMLNEFGLNNFSYPSVTSSTQQQMLSNYSHTQNNVKMNEYSQSMRQPMQPMSPSSSTPNMVNVPNVRPNMKQPQHINQNCSLQQGTPHVIGKKPVSPLNQALPKQTTVQQCQNGANKQNRLQSDNSPPHDQPGIMNGINPNVQGKMQMKVSHDQTVKMSPYQNSLPNMSYSTGPSVPSSTPFNTSFCNGNPNLRGAYQCQTRAAIPNQVQSLPHQQNPYMQGQMVNNVSMMRAQMGGNNKQVLRGPPPDYRQAAMMQHVVSSPSSQDGGQMQYHPAFRQNQQQPANQSLPSNVKIINPNANMTAFRPSMQRINRPTLGGMNPMVQSQQGSNWIHPGQRMSPSLLHGYPDSHMQRNPQMMDTMTMHNGPTVSNNSVNQINMQQCVQMVPRMRPDVTNNRHVMQITPQVVGHMPQNAAAMSAMNKQCQMQNVPNQNNTHVESYGGSVNNNVVNHIPNNQMTPNMGNLSHGAMSKVQLSQMNSRQSPMGMQMNQNRLPGQMMHGSPEMMHSVGMNPQISTYPQNMPSHNNPLQVPNHINGLATNNPMGHHMPGNVMMHNSNHVSGPIMTQIPDIKCETNSQTSQPSTPNNDYDMIFNDSSFRPIMK